MDGLSFSGPLLSLVSEFALEYLPLGAHLGRGPSLDIKLRVHTSTFTTFLAPQTFYTGFFSVSYITLNIFSPSRRLAVITPTPLIRPVCSAVDDLYAPTTTLVSPHDLIETLMDC